MWSFFGLERRFGHPYVLRACSTRSLSSTFLASVIFSPFLVFVYFFLGSVCGIMYKPEPYVVVAYVSALWALYIILMFCYVV